MPTIKTEIAVGEALLDRVDALSKELHLSQSQLFVIAMDDFLRRHEGQELLDAVNRAHEDGDDEKNG